MMTVRLFAKSATEVTQQERAVQPTQDGHDDGGSLLQCTLFIIVSNRRDSTYAAQSTSQVDAGFLEGIVRGYKTGLLTQNQYNNLTQCESIEGARISHSNNYTERMLLVF